MTINLSSIRTLALLGFVGAVVISLGVGVATGADTKKRVANPAALVASNLSALRSPATRLADLPAGAQAPSRELSPAAGAVHSLGRGKAAAWETGAQVCFAMGPFAGCVANTPKTRRGISSALVDPDQIGSGIPAAATGLAVDGVVGVTATLDDGRTLSTAPVENWYEIQLPDGIAPWQVRQVVATFRNGDSITTVTGARRPGVLG